MKGMFGVSETVMKEKGFNADEPQEGISNSSQGKPRARYLMAVRGNASVYDLIVQMDDKSNLFFDPGKSMPQANPVFFGCFRNSMMQAAEPASAQEASVKFFCCA